VNKKETERLKPETVAHSVPDPVMSLDLISEKPRHGLDFWRII
jgi:hypothetical protein